MHIRYIFDALGGEETVGFEHGGSHEIEGVVKLGILLRDLVSARLLYDRLAPRLQHILESPQFLPNLALDCLLQQGSSYPEEAPGCASISSAKCVPPPASSKV